MEVYLAINKTIMFLFVEDEVIRMAHGRWEKWTGSTLILKTCCSLATPQEAYEWLEEHGATEDGKIMIRVK